jgi:geranylgeranyl transferase type-2 subunit beta
MSSYLSQLTMRLARGLAVAPAAFRTRHADFLLAAQNPDGGFSGREGGSDLYYTGLALRGLACLGSLSEPTVGRAAGFMRSRLLQPASVVDFMSFLYAARLVESAGGPDVLSEHGTDWPVRVAAALESFRKSDGGYAKATDGTAGSTYHTFLVALCYELIGLALPEPEQVIAFVRSRRRDDGGYVEVVPARRGGTNPTAAAIALLRIFHAADERAAAAAIDFLVRLQSSEGGFRANDRAPMADLLSTFTALLTLTDLGAGDRIDGAAVRRFIDAIELPSGGFRGGLWDQLSDVEYTFYGLGVVALLGVRE